MKSTLKINGFTLIEVMVSIVLLTISLLGLAALQSSSTKFDHQAYLRSQSVMLAGDMIDRMRSNSSAATSGHYTVSPTPTSYTTDCSLLASSCSPEELSTYDLIKWNNLNSVSLPSGVGQIRYTRVATFIVGVYWIEQEDEKQVRAGYLNPCDGSFNEELHCFQMEVQL